MSKRRSTPEPPPACYAMVIPGLEPVTEEEVKDELGAEVKRSGRGIVVFRVEEITPELLQLRTTEDVFLLGWGTDELTYRAEDLDKIRRWTAREVDWDRLLRLHHSIHPKPKGKPTYRLVTQMTGEHGYRRVDARKALAQGLAGKLPASWKHADENAAVEVWLTIHGATAVCGLRLSDRSMRHRTYKTEHRPASLRPTVAAAMVRLAGIRPHQVYLDPMCGAGTILGELLAVLRGSIARTIQVWGGDLDAGAVKAAAANLRRLGQPLLSRWDATQLPIPDESVDCILSNPPFGKQLSSPEEIGPLYRRVVQEADRVLKPGGRAVLLVGDFDVLRDAIKAVGWKRDRQVRVRVLGQPAVISVWKK
jgi:tRNA (guanine6-N2)-methyltransferase